MAAQSIYLDYNATAPLRPEVLAKMQEILKSPANPSSAHSYGREAKKQLEAARKSLSAFISAWPDEIIFTGSGTEANHMVLRGYPQSFIAVCAIEHSSVLKAAENATQISVTRDGIVDLGILDAILKHESRPKLLSIMLANNETGVIQPIAQIAALCKKYQVLLHCDAVQALGKIPVDFGALGVDMLTLSAHKCGGPVGAAALVVRRGLPITPLLTGGGQEKNLRAGTENVAAIAGFAIAVEKSDFAQMTSLQGWLNHMEAQMEKSGATIIGKAAPRLPNTSCVIMLGVSSEVQLIDFDLNGFAVSAGSACSSGRIEPSHVLMAMGVPNHTAGNAIRISGGWGTKEAEIKAFTQIWLQTCARLAQKIAG